MKIFLLLFLTACSFTVGNANAPLDLYTIDASKRGQDFFNTLTTVFTQATTSGEVVIQTQAVPAYLRAPGVSYGLIPYVQVGTNQNVTFPYKAPNSTLFIFAYNPNGARGITQITQFLVVGIEQIVTAAYRNTISPPFPQNGVFSTVYSNNVLPLYTLNPTLRAADVQDISQKFLSSPGAFNGNSSSQLWILTTLSGPFYVPFATKIAPGAIPNVTGISVLSNEFLLITYKPLSSLFSWSVIVSAEQVQQIVFYPTNYPSS